MKRTRYKTRIWLRWILSRWPWAELMNRSDKHCWADLCSFGCGHRSLRESLGGGSYCKAEADAPMGACYCGKFASPEFRAKYMDAQ